MHTAKLKSDNPILKNRWAKGYYCKIEGKHYIVLDDAEIVYKRREKVIRGLVEIQPETLEEK